MNSENETPKTDPESPPQDQESNIDSNIDTETEDLNVKELESNTENEKNAKDCIADANNEILLETKDDETNFSNNESNTQELTTEKTSESQECDVLKNVDLESCPDAEESMQVDTPEQLVQPEAVEVQQEDNDSIAASGTSVSKDLDGISDVESQDPLDQQGKKSDTDSKSLTVTEDVNFLGVNTDNESVTKTDDDDFDSNVNEKDSSEVQLPDSSNVDSPEPMDITDDNNMTRLEIEKVKDISDESVNVEKCNDLSEEGSNKSPAASTEASDAGETKSTQEKSDTIERVNTEFVQISQDKQDDSQIESHSMDAEDPFGGDNLIVENSEQSETEAISKSKANFEKMGSQADNLQDVINANEAISNEEKDNLSSENGEKLNENRTSLSDVSEDRSNSLANDASEFEKTDKQPLEASDDSKSLTDAVEEKDKISDKEKETEKESEKESEKETGKETENETGKEKEAEKVKEKEKSQEKDNVPSSVEAEPSVLPGQDDELCIIPDSMKDVEDNRKAEEPVANESEKTEESLGNVIKEANVKEKAKITVVTDAKEKPVNEGKETAVIELSKSPGVVNVSQSITDVIDLEEETEKTSEVEEIQSTETCKQCNQVKICKIKVKVGTDLFSVCSKACKSAFKSANNKAMDIPSDGVNSKREKRCASCLLIIETGDERCLSWETMEFCNEECLGKFQTKYGSYCRNCNGSVQAVSLGKYCVRFGYDVRQFCCSVCLEEFKKGLKVCTYCQKDISAGTEGFLAPVGDKGQFKDFCTQDCMEKYSRMSSTEPPIVEKKACSVCQEEKLVHCEVQIDRAAPVAICSDPCFAAFKFVNKVDPDQCSTCKKFFELPNKKSFVVFYEKDAHTFCTKTCLNIFIITNRKIVPCSWCKVKKYNFDMIKKELKTGQVMMMCSLNCLTLYQVSINAVSARRIKCDYCKEVSQAQYHLTMSDATIRNFCSYNCVMNFQGQYTKSPITIPSSDDHPVPTGVPKRTLPHRSIVPTPAKPTDIQAKKIMPVISSVTSLAAMGNGQVSPTTQPTTPASNTTTVVQPLTVQAVQTSQSQIIYKQQVITRPTSPVKIHNKSTQCKPLVHTKGVSVRPHPCTKSTQTDEIQKTIIPIPVPIYVPFPLYMYNMPFPVPTPFPLPIPVPIFVPTTRNSAKGIMKDIKRIQEKIPSDPFEAELLMMAEMVATEKKTTESDSDSVDENRDETGDNPSNTHADGYNAEDVDSNNTFSEDMLQMALKMATELDEPAVDLEAALTPSTITPTQTQSQTEVSVENDAQPERLSSTRGRKRTVSYKPRSAPSKRGRRSSGVSEVSLMQRTEENASQQPRFNEPVEKPDANMALKYTFGVNAWRHWVVTKNAELEKQNTPNRKVKLFKTDLLQLTADELNYSLVLFVQEVRKPNGAEYAPDTIYYLCLGIQQYLFENNRIDNIFTDSYYEQFTDHLNDIAKKFSVLYNDAQYIVTRVEEEHLWESKQLGAHSPHVLLSTLMFFNTKHFNLVTVEEHMQLSFSHIMKHWKRNPAAQPSAVAGKVPGSRNVLLRFYPPQSALEANSRKKKVYEQQENEDNPLRCPVKLYEFYLSKCPESVKTRNDVFYLLPERSCVPDSPVWYSTSALAKEHLVKMLYRIKMVKEINIALLNS